MIEREKLDRTYKELLEEKKTDKPECAKSAAKDEFYYDSVVEAVTLFNIPNGYEKIMINRIENTDIPECPALVWTGWAVPGIRVTWTTTGGRRSPVRC